MQGSSSDMDPSVPQVGGYMMQGNFDPMAYGMGQGVMMQPMLQQNMGQDPTHVFDAASTAEQRAKMVEEARLRKLKEDTYKVRRMEGRPKHGYTSVASIFLSSFAAILQLGALTIPAWRASWIGVFGYPASRGWGLFAVQGREKKLWHKVASDTCSIYGQLNVGGMCVTPACLWYKLKCTTYIQFFILSYGVGAVLIICFVLHMLAITWLARLQPRTIKYAAMWWPIGIALNVSFAVVWYIVTEGLFETLAEKSYYPSPSAGVCIVASAVAQAFLVVCAWCSCNLMRWWPEIDIQNFEADSEEEDDDDDDGGETKQSPQSMAAQKENTAPAPMAPGTVQTYGMHPQGGDGAEWQQSYAMPGHQDYYTHTQFEGYDGQPLRNNDEFEATIMPTEVAWATPAGMPPSGVAGSPLPQ